MSGLFCESYPVNIGWTGSTTGLFRIGVSTIAGSDVLGTAFPGGFGGALDDMSPYVLTIHTKRGRDSRQNAMRMGEATLVLNDKAGLFNPEDAASPLAGNLLPGRPAKVEAVYNTITYPLFRGFVRSIYHKPIEKETHVNLVDLFWQLNNERARVIIPATGPIRTDEVIEELLTAVGWTDVALIDLDVGDVLPDFVADGTKTALQHIEEILTVDQGVFFITPAGVARYISRWNLHIESVPMSTLQNVSARAEQGIDGDKIKNVASASMPSGAHQIAKNLASIAQVGFEANLDHVESMYFRDDTHALSFAQDLVHHHGTRDAPVWAYPIGNVSGAASLQAMLERDVSEHVKLIDEGSGFSRVWHIESIEHNVGAGKIHTTTWGLSETPDTHYFQIGISQIGGSHVFAY